MSIVYRCLQALRKWAARNRSAWRGKHSRNSLRWQDMHYVVRVDPDADAGDSSWKNKNAFIGASRGKKENKMLRLEDQAKLKNKTPSWGRLPGTRTVDGFAGSETTLGTGKRLISSNPREHRKSFWTGRTVPLGAQGMNLMMQRRGPAGEAPKTAPDELICDSWLSLTGSQEAAPPGGRNENQTAGQQAGPWQYVWTEDCPQAHKTPLRIILSEIVV